MDLTQQPLLLLLFDVVVPLLRIDQCLVCLTDALELLGLDFSISFAERVQLLRSIVLRYPVIPARRNEATSANIALSHSQPHWRRHSR